MFNGILDVKLLEVASGNLVEAHIEPVTTADFMLIKKSKDRFDKFDWTKYKGKEVYKLRIKENDLIVGLLCIIEHRDPGIDAIEIDLLELSSENLGKKKNLDYIGGCLIAFACRESFKRGHDGCVFLTPKTALIEHYTRHYGFAYEPVKTSDRPNGFMVLFEQKARNLIKKYLDRS